MQYIGPISILYTIYYIMVHFLHSVHMKVLYTIYRTHHIKGTTSPSFYIIIMYIVIYNKIIILYIYKLYIIIYITYTSISVICKNYPPFRKRMETGVIKNLFSKLESGYLILGAMLT